MENKKRLIDAHEAKAKLRSVHEWFDGPPQTDQDKLAQAVVKMCVEEVDKLKPVDAVEVVRCKDCKNGRQPWLEGQTMVKCMVGKTMLVTPEHFCSYGERKDNGRYSE